MPAPLDEQSLDTLFRTARTHNGWLPKPLPEGTAQRLFDLVKMGPTSANCSPARFVFIESKAAKERLRPTLSPGNVDKTMAAPLAIIVALDTKFYDQLPKLFPHADARSWFADNEAVAALTAFRNGTLQGGYMILAARALGLDVGVMSGFDNGLVDAEFFPDGQYKSNFLMTIGYGDPTKLFGRSPRFDFDEACSIL